MEFSLPPQGFMEFLQNNNHQAVLLFCKNSMKPRGHRLNSMALKGSFSLFYHFNK